MKRFCNRCSGTGSVCLACDRAVDDCECGEDAMPCTCEVCEGNGRDQEEARKRTASGEQETIS
jgi:hypothetical protein